jgi:hypothetical protein
MIQYEKVVTRDAFIEMNGNPAIDLPCDISAVLPMLKNMEQLSIQYATLL